MSYIESLMSTGETVQLVRRAHWIALTKVVLIYGTATLVLLALAMGGLRSESQEANDTVRALLLVLALLPAFILAREIARWYTHQYIVTSRRVMEVSGILNKRVSDSNLDKVNDIVFTQSVLGRVLNYGDIEIITGSDVGVDVLRQLAGPIEFKRTMMDNKEDFDTLARTTLQRLSEPPGADEDAGTALERLASLRDRGLITEDDYETRKAAILARM
jgi:uncharacterized membrane protein YdbT with pleckstrin-like domain